jgi:NAD(P)-dependent dehydrogenase (short-subunit alcohol dehydrogenase family)
MGQLDGKVALVTGAGSGIGKACSLLFAREGAKVLATDISGAQQATAALAGDGALAVQCDVTDEAQVEEAVDRAVSELGGLDVVVNAAGIVSGASIVDASMDEYDAVLDVDLRGTILGMKHAVRAMLAAGSGGAIVNFAAIGGLTPSAGNTLYHAATGAVIAATKSVARDYGAHGIRVNVICPGLILTEGIGAMGMRARPENAGKSALGRAGEPDEVARVAAFLASDAASFVTGVTLPVDGGWVIRLP